MFWQNLKTDELENSVKKVAAQTCEPEENSFIDQLI